MEYCNKLAGEKSPYLLQHAANPVEWFPWGEEAFDKACKEDKPVFLSAGYSTCHWCHVMEEESFSDPEVAELLNDTFVCIKVDREERPDIDGVYMAVCQLMNNSGGWPLNVFLTPEGKPFFAATYFPKRSRGQMPGLMEMVPRIKFLWGTQRESLVRSADEIVSSLNNTSIMDPGDIPGEKILDRAYRNLEKSFDQKWGGFSDAPKFPMPAALMFLSAYSDWKDSGKALDMATESLKMMSLGGIMDHLGGGFHRYSTDRYWKVPHFEKMLYDQALILSASADIYSKTKDPDIINIMEMTASCIISQLSSPGGMFYSASSADSEEGEGRYYLWSLEELKELIGSDWDLFCMLFPVAEEGNFQEDQTGTRNGLNILYMQISPEKCAQKAGISTEDMMSHIRKWRKDLLARRNRRTLPFMDKKILSDWNGLAISALSSAGEILEKQEWIEAAVRCADGIDKQMISSDGILYHRSMDGDIDISGFLDDYAFYAEALLELHRSTGQFCYIEKAELLVDKMIDLFHDSDKGGFFFVDSERELFFRPKDAYDGASVSGNAVALKVLLSLSELVDREDYREKALLLARVFSGRIEKIPSSHTFLLKTIMENLK